MHCKLTGKDVANANKGKEIALKQRLNNLTPLTGYTFVWLSIAQEIGIKIAIKKTFVSSCSLTIVTI